MKQCSQLRKKAHDSHERVTKSTVEYFRKKNKCSKYAVKEKVLVRLGKKGKKAPKRHQVFIGKVVKIRIEYKVILTKFNTRILSQSIKL